jgi:hypothetical protein
MKSYWELQESAAPGWALREGWAGGPAAERGQIWLWAPTFEDAVWRTWCHLFGHFEIQDLDTIVWPAKPSDWESRIARARAVWNQLRSEGKRTLVGEPKDDRP